MGKSKHSSLAINLLGFKKSIIFLGLLCCASCGSEEGLPQVGDTPEVGSNAPTTLPPPESDYEEATFKWGFADSTGRLVIAAKYDEVRSFGQEGLALVRQNGRWHFINQRGQQVGQDWRAAWPFREGLARVQSDDDLFGFVNRQGQIVIPTIFPAAGDFHEGHAWVRNEPGYGLIDSNGQIVIDPQYDKLSNLSHGRLVFEQDGQYGLRDFSQVIIPPTYDRLTDDGGQLRARQGKLYGYLQSDGKWQIEPAYQMASPFVDDRAAVMKDGQWQLIDLAGQNYLTQDYQQVFSAGEGLWIVEASGRYGAVDRGGQLVIALEYDEIQPFSSGLAAYSQNDLWGYLRPDGSQAFPAEFGLAWPFQGEQARVATRDGFVMIDQAGNIRIRPGYRDMKAFGELGLLPIQVYR
ncbi:MAG: WG repeat-containing protein [Bacteroidota bacterium]